MYLGCEAAPTNRSVPAKQDSKMLYLLCNLGERNFSNLVLLLRNHGTYYKDPALDSVTFMAGLLSGN